MFDTDLMLEEEAIACEVCLGGHDDDIHDATIRIHQWLRAEVTKFWDEEIPLDEEPIEFFLMDSPAA